MGIIDWINSFKQKVRKIKCKFRKMEEFGKWLSKLGGIKVHFRLLFPAIVFKTAKIFN